MKAKNEPNTRKEEVEAESKEPRKLTEEELAQVSGGAYVKEGYDSVTFGAYIEDHYDPNTDGTYIKGLTDQYTGGGSYIEPGYPEDYYTGSH